jgi:hypothetical protein
VCIRALPRAYDSGPCLPTEAGSGAAMCPTAPDPASLLGRAPVLSRVAQLWTPPP